MKDRRGGGGGREPGIERGGLSVMDGNREPAPVQHLGSKLQERPT